MTTFDPKVLLRRLVLAAVLVLALVLSTQAASAATKPGSPGPNKGGSAANFKQLKQQVDRQAKKIKALETKMAWYDSCTTYVLDVGAAMDVVVAWVAPLDTTWVPLDNAGLFALAVAPECVEYESASTKGTQSVRPVMPGVLERVR